MTSKELLNCLSEQQRMTSLIRLLLQVQTDLDVHYLIWLPLPASGEFCLLLLIFANSLDPDQAGENVAPDQDPNCFTL